MPSRNVRKIYTEDAYYHVYNRGVNKEAIFRDDEDYRVFLNLFKRLLCREPEKSRFGKTFNNIHGAIELNAYCLMPNHFHALIYQRESKAMTKLFQSAATAYASHFNKKYGRVGHVFQGCFRASLINNHEYFQHISCYIHLNPTDYLNWKYSSLPYFSGKNDVDWIHPKKILEAYGGIANYLERLGELAKDAKLSEITQHILSFSTDKV